MKTIPLTRGLEAIVDDEDFEMLNRFKWHADKLGATFYARRHGPSPRRLHLYMHREILGLALRDKKEVDHLDGNGLNNRRNNLRICSPQENRRNQVHPRNNSSGVKGVYSGKNCRSKPWRAQITVDGEYVHLGYFRTRKEASNAYDCAAIVFFGRFGRLNNLPTN